MSLPTVFQRVLIANRGVIAQRIARTCRELGIEVLMIYAPQDRHLPWLNAADRVFCCDYTDREQLLQLAQRQQAAIHPGYGFLAEDAAFAARCEAAGVPWIGPSAEVLALTGHKQRCLAHLKSQGIPCLPHLVLSAPVPQHLEAAAWSTRLHHAGVSLPCLIKPSAGGGGQGMIWIEKAEQLPEALNQASAFGTQTYGCGDLLLEQALPQARHIEVQILADHTGKICIVGDRDCSLQRRRQKIVEEGPGGLSPDTRQQLYALALPIAKALGLNQVSTLEFLWDGETFWFLEANPRLQVEHAVSEALTSLDLVACQIACAQGESLSVLLQQQGQQEPLHTQGHAIEVRLYAESPETHLPTTGQVLALTLPTGHGLRIENSLYPGMVVSADYDGLLMKIIAHGPTREHSRRRLLQALKTLVIQGDHGLQTNQASLLRLLEHPDFMAGNYHTQSAHSLCENAPSAIAPQLQQLGEQLIPVIQGFNPHPETSGPGTPPQTTIHHWRPSHW